MSPSSLGSVLVTGATGFIGQPLCAALRSEGADVIEVITPWHEPSDERRPIVRCDLRDGHALEQLLGRINPTSIVNLATSRPAPEHDARQLGPDAVRLMLAAVGQSAGHLVHAGSATEVVTSTPTSPDHELTAVSTHGRVKAEATKLVSDAVAAASVDAVTVRPFLVYGPGEPDTRLIPRAIDAAFDGCVLPLASEPAGRDYVYIDDVVEAIVRIVTDRRVSSMPVDLCTGVSTTNTELIDLVAAVTGRPIAVEPGAFPNREWDRTTWTADPEPLRTLLGRAPVALTDGISRCVAERRAR